MTWVVLGAEGEREHEARASAEAFLAAAVASEVVVHGFRDGFFPYVGGEVKDVFEELKSRLDPDLILTHARHDLHQDHRLVCELTWNTWRDHLILEYEIPKYDGDLGTPNVFVPVSEEIAREKVRLVARGIREPDRQALVRRGALPRADARARDGGTLAERLRGGVHLSQALPPDRMIFAETGIDGVWVIEPERHRGRAGLLRQDLGRGRVRGARAQPELAQCSISYNRARGTLRGLHYQAAPHEEAKLVRCTAGAIFDVAVDLRPDSPTFREWFGVELSAENRLALYVPEGCAHGFLTLADDSEVALPDLAVLRARGGARRSLGRSGVRDRAGRARSS